MEPTPNTSSNPQARLTGAVYLAYFLTAMLGQGLISDKLVFLGTTANLISAALYAVLTILLYLLFKPVNRNLSLLAAILSLAGCVCTVLTIFHLAAARTPLFFFAPYCLLLGYLILRSTFLPRALGVLMMLAGIGWILFLIPPIGTPLTVPIEGLGILAEALLMLWLLIKGVNIPRWHRQATQTT